MLKWVTFLEEKRVTIGEKPFFFCNDVCCSLQAIKSLVDFIRGVMTGMVVESLIHKGHLL